MYKRSDECYQTFLWTKADFSAIKDSMSLSKLVCVSLFAMSCELMDALSCRTQSRLLGHQRFYVSPYARLCLFVYDELRADGCVFLSDHIQSRLAFCSFRSARLL